MRVISPLLLLSAGLAVALSTAGCGSKTEPELGQATDDLVDKNPAPPTLLHWVTLEGTARLVFTRSVDDSSKARVVDHYQVCTQDNCVDTKTNYFDFPLDLAKSTLGPVLVRGVSFGGLVGEDSPAVTYGKTLTVEPPIKATPPVPAEDSGVEGGAPDAEAPEAGALSTVIPQPLPAPIFGPIERLGNEVGIDVTEGPWAFWQHPKVGFHGVGKGIGGADDTYSWDVDIRVLSGGWNLDARAEFYSVGFGTVVPWIDRSGAATPTGRMESKFKLGGEYYRPILVDHSGWFSGYLHCNRVTVLDGDYVTPWVNIGTIGNSKTEEEHLHFAVYEGTNQTTGLVSKDVVFEERAIQIQWKEEITTLKRWEKQSLGALALRPSKELPEGEEFFPRWDLNLPEYDGRVGWISKNTEALTISKRGEMTPKLKSAGVEVKVYFHGLVVSRTMAIE